MILPIVKYGDPVLRAKGKRIAEVDDRIRDLASDMLETMHAANGVGLAAQQIGERLQMTVLDISAVETLDSFFARTVSETAQMVNLMGGRTIIAGMRPAVAITATQIGLTLGNIETALNIDRALDMATRKPRSHNGAESS